MSFTVVFYLKEGGHFIEDDLNTFHDALIVAEREMMDDERIKDVEILHCKKYIDADKWRSGQ